MRRLFKKYSYLAHTRIRLAIESGFKSVRSRFNQSDPAEAAPFGYESLPWPVDWEQFYPGKSLVVEIGSGHGEVVEELSGVDSNTLIVGFELVSKYVRMASKKVAGRDGAIVFKADGYEALERLFRSESLSGVYVLFPDPWHKKKHNKRRPLTAGFLDLVYKRLQSGGTLFFATDWMEYYDFVSEQFQGSSSYSHFDVEYGEYVPREHGLPETHYYKKWKKMGRGFKYIRLVKK